MVKYSKHLKNIFLLFLLPLLLVYIIIIVFLLIFSACRFFPSNMKHCYYINIYNTDTKPCYTFEIRFTMSDMHIIYIKLFLYKRLVHRCQSALHRNLDRMCKYPIICVQVLAIVCLALQTEKCVAQEDVISILSKSNNGASLRLYFKIIG